MGLSCECENYGIMTVGDPRECTCRTPRNCSACCRPITAGSLFNIWSMFDYDCIKPKTPIYLCEECGDMARNLITLGYCFSIGPGIREQWLEYLYEIEPDNPVFKNEGT
jgi:hypothetical protein